MNPENKAAITDAVQQAVSKEINFAASNADPSARGADERVYWAVIKMAADAAVAVVDAAFASGTITPLTSAAPQP